VREVLFAKKAKYIVISEKHTTNQIYFENFEKKKVDEGLSRNAPKKVKEKISIKERGVMVSANVKEKMAYSG
jgi:hypothetical protein